MACTTQSAEDYVKRARRHLVGELKNLSVIVENLYQKEVFTDEEVSKIQAENGDYNKTREILSSVIKKGEDACYELLRIIDITRKRTLGRTSALPEKKSESEFDLHHWISCFSFKEDAQMDMNYLQGSRPCHRYQAKLKSKAQKKSNDFWMANKNLFEDNKQPDLSYASLVLDTQGNVSPSKIKKIKAKKSKLSRPKKLQAYIPEDKQLSPSDLLKTNRNILLFGKPGIGKTALSQELLRLWAERDSRELDYMFYFDMREMSCQSTTLEDLLFSEYSEPDEGKEEVLQDIKKNSDNVTVIFDGITDLSSSSVVQRLVEKDLLPEAKVIITCRAGDEEELCSGDFLRVEVKGFSENTITTYLSAMLGEEQMDVFNTELLTLCHVPMYALMVAACFSSQTPGDSPKSCSITGIYINIVRFCLQMNSSRKKTKDLNTFIKNKREEILSLAEAAFKATEEKTVILKEPKCEDSCVLSFLKPLVIKVACTESITTYAFLHYTMQEFFAALWLLKDSDKIKDVFKQSLNKDMKHMKHLIPFMCGLLTQKNPSLMKRLIPAQELKNTSDWFFKEVITTFSPRLCDQDEANNEDSVSDETRDILFICQCLHESQCPDACIHFLETLDYDLDLSGESLDPYPCCAVAYVIAQSQERKIQLNLEDVTVSKHGLRRLFGCLENVLMCGPLPQQLWEISLLSPEPMDHISLLGLDQNRLHLHVEGKTELFERAVTVMQKITMKVNVCLHWDRGASVCKSLCDSLLKALPQIASLSFRKNYMGPLIQDQNQRQDQSYGTLDREEKKLLLDLCLRAVLHNEGRVHSTVETLLSLFSVHNHLNICLDLCQHFQSEGCLNFFSKLKPLFQFAPSVWIINLSETKSSLLLEALKLQSEKKPVKLLGISHEESEVRRFLQCLPYISQLSFSPRVKDSDVSRFLVDLFCAAAEREQQTGETTLQLLASVCRYQTFPYDGQYYDDDERFQTDVLLDVFSHVKDLETETRLRVLPSLQSVFQFAPSVWIINLSETKSSLLLEALKLQSEKKPVKLLGISHEESEVRRFLQCLPYISQLSCDPGIFQVVCTIISVRSREEAEPFVSLLKLVDFTLTLTGQLPSRTCRSVGRVLGLCGSKVDLIFTPSKVSVRGASLLFRHTKQLHSLRMSNNMAVLLPQYVRRGKLMKLSAVENLSLAPQRDTTSNRDFLQVVSGLGCLLRYWTVRQLDLTDLCVPAQTLITLLLHPGPLTVKLNEEVSQQLLSLLHEIQDKDLTQSFLSKVGGDLTSIHLTWDLLHWLLQHSSAQTITVNLRKSRSVQESFTRLLPFMDRIKFKRPSPSFMLTAMSEVYKARASSVVPALLRSFDQVITLTCRELDSEDCAALLFTLKHNEGFKLNLMWTSIPSEEMKSLLFTLDRVSQLSVDRNLLLKLVHCCAAPDAQQGAVKHLLRVLQHRLDLSCSSCVELPQEEDQSLTLSVTAEDCRAISSVLRHSDRVTQLNLQDCEVEGNALDLLFPVLDRVHLRASKAVLLQLLTLVPVRSERDSVRRAVSLCGALDGELDLSHTPLDQMACEALALMLDYSEGLTELDLSHCHITDQLLLSLRHLHKAQVLDLSHNNITDASSDLLLELLSVNPSILSVRLFRNNIKDQRPFNRDGRFEIW